MSDDQKAENSITLRAKVLQYAGVLQKTCSHVMAFRDDGMATTQRGYLWTHPLISQSQGSEQRCSGVDGVSSMTSTSAASSGVSTSEALTILVSTCGMAVMLAGSMLVWPCNSRQGTDDSTTLSVSGIGVGAGAGMSDGPVERMGISTSLSDTITLP